MDGLGPNQPTNHSRCSKLKAVLYSSHGIVWQHYAT